MLKRWHKAHDCNPGRCQCSCGCREHVKCKVVSELCPYCMGASVRGMGNHEPPPEPARRRV